MAKKTWISKDSTLSIAGKKISYEDTFDEKDINSDLLEKLIKEEKVADKVITAKQLEKEVEKVAKTQLDDLKKQHQVAVTELEEAAAEKLSEVEEKLAAAVEAKTKAEGELTVANDKIKKLESK